MNIAIIYLAIGLFLTSISNLIYIIFFNSRISELKEKIEELEKE